MSFDWILHLLGFFSLKPLQEMDRYEKSLRERRSQQDRRSPSFSSTLLDAIYRSIDDECDNRELILYRETSRKKHGSGSCNFQQVEQEERKEMMTLRRSCRIEQWVEKKNSEKVRKASDLGDGYRKSHRENVSMVFNSTSSSSYSSYGDFSSSETESFYGSRASNYTSQRPKPIRTGMERSEKPLPCSQKNTHIPEIYISSSLPKDRQKTKKEGFIKSKQRAASKIYGELKKAKHPISPGVRLASFLNSLFAAGNAKKAKISGGSDDLGERKTKSAQASTCSSASSYSRSCLSKTPSSRGSKPSNGVKRSVRFYPVSIIFDEDCRPCGQKCLYEDAPDSKIGQYPKFIGEELKFQLMEKSKRVEEAAKDLLKGYQKKSELLGEVMRDVHEEEDYEDDDDAASYSSSDLFELENLTSIDIERYREELPVYETTHLSTNYAIANGLIM